MCKDSIKHMQEGLGRIQFGIAAPINKSPNITRGLRLQLRPNARDVEKGVHDWGSAPWQFVKGEIGAEVPFIKVS